MSRRHISEQELIAFLDTDTSAARDLEIENHIETCRRCRDRVEYMAQIRSIDFEHPDMRFAGRREHVVRIPDRGSPKERQMRPIAAAAVLAVVASTVIMAWPDQAGAGSSQLLMELDGDVLSLEYKPGAVLAGAGMVKIRGRYRTADERPPSRGLDNHYILGREFEVTTDDGFEANLRLPEGAVYAVMVAEDSAGNVDSNGGRMWEYLETGPDGKPTLAALRQQFMVLLLQHPLQARAPLERMIELYPWSPEGFGLMMSYDLQSGAPRDSLITANRKTFIGLSASMDAFPADEYVAGLLYFARVMGDRNASDYLAGVLNHQAPGHSMSVLNRLRGSSSLHTYENEWSMTANPLVAAAAWRLSRTGDDPLPVKLWTDRYTLSDPAKAPAAAETLVESELGRDFGIQMAEREIDRILTGYYDEFRPLQLGDIEFERVKQRSVLNLRSSLSEALIAEGMEVAANVHLSEIEAGQARMASLLPDPKPLLPAIVVADDGAETDLQLLLRDQVSVVFVWARPSDVRAPESTLLSELAEGGVRTLGITAAADDPGSDLEFDLYSDPKGEAAIAFGRWGVRSIYVVGPGPRILLRTADVKDAVSVALSIR